MALGNEYGPSQFDHTGGIAESGSCGGRHVDGRVLAQWQNGDSKVSFKDFASMAAQADLQRIPVVKIVHEQFAVQRYAGHISGIIQSQNQIILKPQILWQPDFPNGGAGKPIFDSLKS